MYVLRPFPTVGEHFFTKFIDEKCPFSVFKSTHVDTILVLSADTAANLNIKTLISALSNLMCACLVEQTYYF